MLNTFLTALSIMGKGMAGIFTVMILISLAVALMGRLGTREGGKEEEKQN